MKSFHQSEFEVDRGRASVSQIEQIGRQMATLNHEAMMFREFEWRPWETVGDAFGLKPEEDWMEPIRWNHEASQGTNRGIVRVREDVFAPQNYVPILTPGGGRAFFDPDDCSFGGVDDNRPEQRPATLRDILDQLFAVIAFTPRLKWHLQTYSPKRCRNYCLRRNMWGSAAFYSRFIGAVTVGDGFRVWPPRNVEISFPGQPS